MSCKKITVGSYFQRIVKGIIIFNGKTSVETNHSVYDYDIGHNFSGEFAETGTITIAETYNIVAERTEEINKRAKKKLKVVRYAVQYSFTNNSFINFTKYYFTHKEIKVTKVVPMTSPPIKKTIVIPSLVNHKYIFDTRSM